MNVTNLLLNILLDDKILQANASKFTILHVTFASNSGTPLANKDVQLKRTYQQIDGKDTSEVLFFKTDAQGKCAITIYALPYENSMSLEVTAFNTTTDIASAKTTLSFIASRSITINAIPTVIQADGTSGSTITVQVKNESYNPMVGDQISFVTTSGVVTALATTDENGRAVARLVSDRRNTFATVKATLVKDATKTASVQVEFSGVEITASANPPSINSSGKDTSRIDVTLIDAAKNPVVGEPINFSKQFDSTRIVFRDSVTNNRGEARCKIVGTGAGIDTIKIESAGASAKVGLNYSSNYLVVDTMPGQLCLANGKDSTRILITYLEGDKTTPIDTATLDVSATIGTMNNDTVFSKRMALGRANNGRLYFYLKNPTFANTATIFVYAKTAMEVTTTSFQLYFRASKIKWIDLMGTPEVIATNGSRAKITAVAYDSMGNRVKDERISFNMSSGPGGGEYLDPATAVTAEDGSAITYLVSGKTPSMFREVWITAGDLYAQKSDTVKFTIAGPPHIITIRENMVEGIDFHDGTFALPVASLVTDVNGNPVADGTEVTFSCKTTGWVIHRPVANFNNGSGWYCYNVAIDTMIEILPFEDLNDNYRCDPGEDINGDSVASRGEDIDGDGLLTVGPPYYDVNHNGKRDYLPGDIAEPWRQCGAWTDSAGHVHRDTVFADFNGNGVLDTYEPLIGWAATMADSTYTRLLREYKAAHHNMGYDIDIPQNGVADPKTAIIIARTVQTIGGKAINKVMYGQSDAWKCEVTVWAESQGVRTESPARFILPIIGGTTAP
jgi:adhesin/invasin